MADDPLWLKILGKLGFNTTQLRWKLYQMERRAKSAKESGPLPTGLKWLQYEHKICRHCGAVNDRGAKKCHRCSKRVPSMIEYRLFRIGGLMLPANAPVTASAFIGVIICFYAVAMVIEGISVLMPGPTNRMLFLFGAFTNLVGGNEGTAWWRWFAFSLAHANIIHIGFNAFATTQIGPIIENSIGRARMLVVITVCQLAAAFGTYFWYVRMQESGFFTIGASGWVFGLIGYGVAHFHRMGDAGRMYRDALMRWAIYGIIFGFVIRANNAAHIGGMLGGVLMAYLPETRGHRATKTEEQIWSAASVLCLALWIAVIGFTAYFAVAHFEILREE